VKDLVGAAARAFVGYIRDPMSKTVAIVDDDHGMRISVERLLNAYGFVTKTFASAEAVLECLAEADIDCLVLDINLGGISGIELYHRLVSCDAAIPTIFITAVDDETTHKNALTSGCVAYLRKPFPGRSLVAAIKTATDGKH
jgi:FixJ family two-component response regulator